MSNNAKGMQHFPMGSTIEHMIQQTMAFLGVSNTVAGLLLVFMVCIILKCILVLLANRHVGYTVAHVATDLRLEFLRALFLSRYQYFLRQRYGDVSITDAARSFTNHFAPNPFKRFWHWLTHHVFGSGDAIPTANHSQEGQG